MSGRAYSIALLFALWLAAGGCPVSAQERAGQTAAHQADAEPQPTNCEYHIATLEAAHHDAGEDGLIIVIARRGTDEDRRDLNRRRLYNARAYLTDYLNVRSPKTIVTAEGEPVKGYGRIELYVGGKLYFVLALRRNADLLVGSCEPEELDDTRQRALRNKLYPWRDTKRRRR